MVSEHTPMYLARWRSRRGKGIVDAKGGGEDVVEKWDITQPLVIHPVVFTYRKTNRTAKILPDCSHGRMLGQLVSYGGTIEQYWSMSRSICQMEIWRSELLKIQKEDF